MKGSNSLSFEYNDEGIRTSKTVNGITHYYQLAGSQILSENWTDSSGVYHVVIFIYDENGSPIGMSYSNSTYSFGNADNYLFVKNIQGDIVHICDEEGNKIVSYQYDAWGTVTSYSGSNTTAYKINPFRYRGYYYDVELGLYYLNSRYYDPATGRFLNADGYVSTRTGLLGYNMFAYCNNSPVNYADFTGNSFVALLVLGGVALFCTIGFSSCSTSEKATPTPPPYSGKANCYAYAMKLENDPQTGQPFTYRPQPGSFSGDKLEQDELKGPVNSVKNRIITRTMADAQALGYNFIEVSSANHIPKQGNWLVALAYDAKDPDYHWWRKNEDGTWYSKLTSHPPENWDYQRATITDPGTCDRGRYGVFFGYYEVGPN